MFDEEEGEERDGADGEHGDYHRGGPGEVGAAAGEGDEDEDDGGGGGDDSRPVDEFELLLCVALWHGGGEVEPSNYAGDGTTWREEPEECPPSLMDGECC